MTHRTGPVSIRHKQNPPVYEKVGNLHHSSSLRSIKGNTASQSSILRADRSSSRESTQLGGNEMITCRILCSTTYVTEEKVCGERDLMCHRRDDNKSREFSWRGPILDISKISMQNIIWCHCSPGAGTPERFFVLHDDDRICRVQTRHCACFV